MRKRENRLSTAPTDDSQLSHAGLECRLRHGRVAPPFGSERGLDRTGLHPLPSLQKPYAGGLA